MHKSVWLESWGGDGGKKDYPLHNTRTIPK
nr:MAG TPA: hypothetical protein [Caudoviricetes sp.]